MAKYNEVITIGFIDPMPAKVEPKPKAVEDIKPKPKKVKKVIDKAGE